MWLNLVLLFFLTNRDVILVLVTYSFAVIPTLNNIITRFSLLKTFSLVCVRIIAVLSGTFCDGNPCIYIISVYLCCV